MGKICISSSREMAVKLFDLTKSNNMVKSPSLFINHNHLQCLTTKKTPQKTRLRHTGTGFFLRQTVLEGHENQLLFYFFSLQNGLIKSRWLRSCTSCFALNFWLFYSFKSRNKVYRFLKNVKQQYLRFLLCNFLKTLCSYPCTKTYRSPFLPPE